MRGIAVALVRTFDADHVGRIANHRDVRPGTLATGPLDVSAVVSSPANFCLFDRWGGFVFEAKSPRIYEVHTLFIPEGRGSHALAAAREALQYMFALTDCRRIETFCSHSNKAAKWLALKCKFQKIDAESVLGHAGDRYALDHDRWVKEILCH